MNVKLPTLATVALVALVLSGCTTVSTEPSPREFADKFTTAETKAWSTGNIDDLKALEDDAVVYHLPGMDLKGWKAHEDYIVKGRETIKDLKQSWKYLSGEGNHIVLDYGATAVMKGDGQKPDQRVSVSYLFVMRLKDKKVAEVWANGSTTTTP